MPASVPSPQSAKQETTNKSEENKERSLLFNKNSTNSDTYKILEQIKTINQGMKKPDKPPTSSSRPQSGAEYVIDEGTYNKIQQIVASIKPSPFSQQQDNNYISNVDNLSQSYARTKALRIDSNLINNDVLPAMPLPYITNIPVMVMPPTIDLVNAKGVLNSIQSTNYQTRQESPSFPFQLQWPLASFFPILVKDPLLGFLHGGGWNNFFEIGQSADVCSRRQKSHDTNSVESGIFRDDIETGSLDDASPYETNVKRHSRVTRSLRKRNISTPNPVQNTDKGKKTKKVSLKPLITRTKTKKPQVEQDKEIVENDGDLRFPFSDFTWFGNKKPVAPSPGFFINKMKVRRGGVAIAGPGGVATAGRGGTAIVGPGGLAYTQPGGLAVAGPAARVIALSPYTDLTSLVSRLHQQSLDGSMPRSFNPLSEGRLVATGPVIYYHPYYNVPQGSIKTIRRNTGTNKRAEYYYNGMNFEEGFSNNSTIIIHLDPKAHALAGAYGIAIANPISQVIVGKNKQVAVAYNPEATAIAGPGGIAHAESDLYLYDFESN